MPQWSKDLEQMPSTQPEKPKFPQFLTLSQVREILNVGMPTIYALLSSGELRGLQLGGRGYLASLLRLLRIVPEIRGEEHPVQCRVFARFVRIAGLRCVAHRA
ncbi:excisionase family DNA binding protein [Arthrobacter pascens]|uniref:helix-turn-helix domain-containing protein n=1 Tax=Arthrobacter pascens TaxID=1677 RepID=UPI0027882CB6|nr:helix-turn-helix domain-containing protein [Arthrobacter pascens]MDQ0636407.1 excisionase family DNA binding protein [Arthrobacter pascens]